MLHLYYLGPNKSSILNKSGLYDLIQMYCKHFDSFMWGRKQNKYFSEQHRTSSLPSASSYT